MTTVNVRDQVVASGSYRALTARAALHHHIRQLERGSSVTLGPLIDLSGTERTRRYLQTRIVEITPPGWHLVTRGIGENQVYIVRVK